MTNGKQPDSSSASIAKITLQHRLLRDICAPVVKHSVPFLSLLLVALLCASGCHTKKKHHSKHHSHQKTDDEVAIVNPGDNQPHIAAPECTAEAIAALPAIEAQTFCTKYAAAYCHAHLNPDCCRGAPRLYDAKYVEKCNTGKTAECMEIVASSTVTSGRMHFDGKTAAQRLRDYECRAFHCSEGLDLFEYSSDIFDGDSRDGSVCADGTEFFICREGSVCVMDNAPLHSAREIIKGVCARTTKKGGDCHTRRDTCEEGLFCEPIVHNDQGEPDLQNGLVFDLPGRCAPAYDAGHACPDARDSGDHFCKSRLCLGHICTEALPPVTVYCQEGTSVR